MVVLLWLMLGSLVSNYYQYSTNKASNLGGVIYADKASAPLKKINS